ncbi:hypothetical protein V5739_09725 [Salinimicrobium sp. TIG7-5_MAKvit]|uniref:hypothetical protein n=1 Tax=Salinimicrobium sp. TIG7-5_MAKvit TaxID=3121289 RepID=UPI003C6DD6B9
MLFTMNKILLFCFFSIIYSAALYPQSNTLSNSPYSLYGLGTTNQLSTGKTNALGKAGIALPSTTFINSLNPASYGAIPLNSFFYDIGLKYEINEMQETGAEGSATNGNFSNLAFAFPINKRSGVGISLLPYTNVGYTISGVQTEIEGSNENFYSYITGSGGLNEIKLNYGLSISERFRIGASGSYLFGKISENEVDYINSNILEFTEANRYNGFRVALGLQYDASEKISFGSTIKLPTSLSGTQEQTMDLYLDGTTLVESSEAEDDIDAFSLPLEVGLGLNARLRKNLSLNLDYTKELWTSTNQEDGLGSYVDQDVVGLGMEFSTNGSPLSYANRIQYRAGLNYSSGNLEISGEKISDYGVSIGLGLPVQQDRNSMFNLMYSYGKKGQVSNGLIQENYHQFSLNISLEDIWFLKSKFQ